MIQICRRTDKSAESVRARVYLLFEAQNLDDLEEHSLRVVFGAEALVIVDERHVEVIQHRVAIAAVALVERNVDRGRVLTALLALEALHLVVGVTAAADCLAAELVVQAISLLDDEPTVGGPLDVGFNRQRRCCRCHVN